MHSRATRTITRAVVVAGTASAIATAFWLVNRILATSELKYLNVSDDSVKYDEEYDEYDAFEQQQLEPDDGFKLLPVVSESDDESENGMVGYTGEYFNAPYDICMLSVSVQKQVDPLRDVSSVLSSDCRLCRAAAGSTMDAASHGLHIANKARSLSFCDTDSSSDGSVLSIGSELGDGYNDVHPTEQWLYVRL